MYVVYSINAFMNVMLDPPCSASVVFLQSSSPVASWDSMKCLFNLHLRISLEVTVKSVYFLLFSPTKYAYSFAARLFSDYLE